MKALTQQNWFRIWFWSFGAPLCESIGSKQQVSHVYQEEGRVGSESEVKQKAGRKQMHTAAAHIDLLGLVSATAKAKMPYPTHM